MSKRVVIDVVSDQCGNKANYKQYMCCCFIVVNVVVAIIAYWNCLSNCR